MRSGTCSLIITQVVAFTTNHQQLAVVFGAVGWHYSRDSGILTSNHIISVLVPLLNTSLGFVSLPAGSVVITFLGTLVSQGLAHRVQKNINSLQISKPQDLTTSVWQHRGKSGAEGLLARSQSADPPSLRAWGGEGAF